ncbi:NUDIX domain-containing protein [Paenibacillus sp. GD4]|uniref:NUDIX hydrolase n=1 Tax=Paenibacillus sp. GD4 TaxID=3068890 RepID=UPI002796A0D7|nr:NUDIX domain-containing protein [Paenibacillus sp. GD4]MDQ1912232.1 NUDIX domain-containing protein [Paenibacillus sp. GD4]
MNRIRRIRTITDSDVQGGPATLLEAVSRYGARGVLVDRSFRVAMMYLSKLDLYKLPGGGIEEGEEQGAAFVREIREETGYEAEIVHELGYIEEHKGRNDFLHYSYCFVAKSHEGREQVQLSDNEIKLGMTPVWMPLEEALALMNEALRSCDDYSLKFMLLRDLTILQVYNEWKSKEAIV